MTHVGIDLHKVESQICVVQEGRGPVDVRIQSTPERLEQVLEPYRGGRILVESSTESEWVARWLEELGHDVVVADPNYAPMYAQRSRRIKTDRRDARALAEACRIGAYRPAHRTSDSQRQVRHLLTVRETLVRARTRAIVVARSLYRQPGLRVRTGMAESFPRRLAELPASPVVRETVAPLLHLIEQLTPQIGQLDQQLEQRAGSSTLVQRLRTVPGVGPVTALGFVAALDGAERFEFAALLAVGNERGGKVASAGVGYASGREQARLEAGSGNEGAPHQGEVLLHFVGLGLERLEGLRQSFEL